jgi:hypothetical protein
MGLEIEYRDTKGRKHDDLGSLVQAEMSKLVDEAARNVERVVRAQRCPAHGKNASISITKWQEGFSYSISGCCDAAGETAERAAEPYIS